VFVDRVIVTLVVLRFQLPHAALAELYRVDRSTVTRAVHGQGRFGPPHARPDRRADRRHRRPDRAVPQVKAKVDAGYRGLAKQFPDQVQAPPLKPKKDATPEEVAAFGAEGAFDPHPTRTALAQFTPPVPPPGR
jgi:hypothetical protein